MMNDVLTDKAGNKYTDNRNNRVFLRCWNAFWHRNKEMCIRHDNGLDIWTEVISESVMRLNARKALVALRPFYVK